MNRNVDIFGLIPLELYYPMFAFFILALTLLIIPKKDLKALFFPGLLWGFTFSIVFLWIFIDLLKLFQYERVGVFKFIGAPFWIHFSWLMALMIFFYFLPKHMGKIYYYLYIAIFSLASTGIDHVFNNIGLLRYHFWNLSFRFIISFIWFNLAAWHYKKLLTKYPDPPN